MPYGFSNNHNRHGSRNISREACAPLLSVSNKVIRSLVPSDFDAILKVINDAAQAYKGVIPDDRWKELYISVEELNEEIEAGVRHIAL